MKFVLRGTAVTGIATLLVTGLLVVAGGSARAASPPWDPDPSSVGGLKFYNSSGTVITHGNLTDAPFAAYVQGTSQVRAGDDKATLSGYLPVKDTPIGAWSGDIMTPATTYPNASAPAPV